MISSWHWDFGDGTSTSYTQRVDSVSHTWIEPGSRTVTLVIETNVNGTTISDTYSMVIMVNPSPLSEFSIASVCAGDSSRFINLSDSNGTVIVANKWKFGDGNTSTTDTSTMMEPVYRYKITGKHNVKLIQVNDLGCTDTVVHPTKIYKLPDARFTPPDGCERKQLVFKDESAIGDTALSLWFWQFGNPEKPQEMIEGNEVTYRYDHAGKYQVFHRVIDKKGCQDTTSGQVLVKTSPVASFTMTENYEDIPGQVKMNNHSYDSIVAYQWTFESGKVMKSEEPVYRYQNDGDYTIELVVKATNGCMDTTFLDYSFHFENLFVPNAFAPTNLSNSTDCRLFKPKGMNLQEYHVMVFDKWGHLLWESVLIDKSKGRNIPEEGWDGTFNGELMPQDVYVWKIHATFTNGKVWEGSDSGTGIKSTMGTVTLIR
jgi:PKD repeat protein